MKTKHEEFEVMVPNLDGTSIAEKVKVTIPLRWDEELKEWLLTPEAHEIIENTKARRMGLMLPPQFKELRERYDYSQKEMGELFQVGEKSWTRWESGKHRPSRSINLLIRALYEGELSIDYLLRRAGKPPREGTEWSSAFTVWQAIAQCQLKDVEILVPQAGEPVGVVFSTGEGRSSLRGRLVQLLQTEQASADKTLWRGPVSRHYTLRSSPPLESVKARFKFPSAA